ncbi:hypothetical protein [Lacipirellula sp.]
MFRLYTVELGSFVMAVEAHSPEIAENIARFFLAASVSRDVPAVVLA